MWMKLIKIEEVLSMVLLLKWRRQKMKFILSQLLFLVAFSLLISGCSSSPERMGGGSIDQVKYDRDDMYCRSQAKKDHPNVAGQLEDGDIPSSGGMSMVLIGYDNCMEERGWKSH
jgi:hypothetical protein